MSRTDAHSNRSISEKLYRAELARHKAARTTETVDEAIRDELAVEHAEIVETGLGTKIHDTLGVGWWFQPRKRTSAELENAIVLSELQREHYLVERPEAAVRWTSGRWSSGQEWEDSLNEHDRRMQARADARAKQATKARVNALLVAQLDPDAPAKPERIDFRALMTEIPSARGGMRMRRARVVA